MDEVRKLVLEQFSAHFSAQPEIVVQAPGRVNLIGEHTDYNDGFVLPVAISCGTVAAARKRSDGLVRLVAADFQSATTSFAINDIRPCATAPWSNYIRGVAAALTADGLPLSGADMLIAGNLPKGAGLSSSASLEMATGLAFAALAGKPDYDRTKLARAGQRAEHEFAGCKCGIMDQLVSASAVAGHALLIDCRSLETRAVCLPDDLAIMIIHSGVSRGLVEGEYNMRRAQCETAARHYGVPALRDLTLDGLRERQAGLAPIVFRRARHVVTENGRTLAAADALTRHDQAALSRLMAESHASMRDDFEITVPAIDRLVEIVGAVVGADGGVRMTGGGFGGAVVALVPKGRVDAVEQAIADKYQAPDGRPALRMLAQASPGAAIIA